jgi:hypothetical protein
MDRTIDASFENFVGVFKEACPKELCDKIIQTFNDLNEKGFGKDRRAASDTPNTTLKKDVAIFMQNTNTNDLRSTNVAAELHKILWQTYDAYRYNYGILNNLQNVNSFALKVQETDLAGGYHVWHFESDSRGHSNRVLTWIIYLNEVEGGETEFLYLSKRIKPEVGTLVLFPAAFTHTHRGNPPLDKKKYIATGWVEF